VAQPLVAATVYELETLRCTGCGKLFSAQLMGFGVAAIVVGVVCTLLVVPFLILTYKSALYRDRLYRILRLPGTCDTNEHAEGDTLHEGSDS